MGLALLSSKSSVALSTHMKGVCFMANQYQSIDYQALIPNHLYGVFVPDEHALLFLGEQNLRYLRHYWLGSARNRNEEFNRYYNRRITLFSLGFDRVRKCKETYGDLVFPELIAMEEHPDLLEPVDEPSLLRRYGATDFCYCGWCRHFWGEVKSKRSSCSVIGHCILIPQEFVNGNGWNRSEPFLFNYRCRFSWERKEFFDTCCLYLKTRAEQARWHQKKAQDAADYLGLLIKTAVSRPIFPKVRKTDHFKVGDKVMVSLPYSCGILPELEGRFVTAEVLGVRATEGEVDLQTDEPFTESGDRMLEKKIRKPTLLLDWEYEHLRESARYREVWLRNAQFYLSSDVARDALRAGLES